METILVAILSVLFTTIGFFVLRAGLRREFNSDAFLGRLQDETARMVAEVNQAADQALTLLEGGLNKTAQQKQQLNRDIASMEKRLSQLRESLKSIQEEASMVNPAPGPSFKETSNTRRSHGPPTTTSPPDPGFVPKPEAKAEAKDEPSSGPRGKALAQQTGVSIRSLIAGLYAEGLSPTEISAELDVPLGEVQLAIAMLQISQGE